MLPDWQLPTGVDRGLWDYLHASDMIAGYDEAMRASPLAAADLAFCEQAFPAPGRLLDLGCGTGRLCRHFAARGFQCLGVDLSDEMLAVAEKNWDSNGIRPSFAKANIVELAGLAPASFDFAACLFSTLGMVRNHDNRARAIASAARVLKPGGRLVLHVHNRYFLGLGWRRVLAQAIKSLIGKPGDITMPQSYGGAPLTLHHFSRREIVKLLQTNGFAVKDVHSVGIDGQPARAWKTYGWLILSEVVV